MLTFVTQLKYLDLLDKKNYRKNIFREVNIAR